MPAKLNLSNINTEQVINYYKTHSKQDTADTFKISTHAVDLIIKEAKFKKSAADRATTIRNGVRLKYGCDNVFQVSEIKQKIKTNCLAKYGVEFTAQTDISKQHIKETCLARYNTTNGGASFEAREKIKQTNLAHWGQESYFGSQEHVQKTKAICQQKYGTEFYTQTQEYHKKAHKQYFYNKEYFDSLPELAVYLYAINNGISIKRCPIRFEYEYNNKKFYYFPDFEIDGKLVEIKGDHFFKKDGTMCNPFDHTQDAKFEAKHQCMLHNNVTIWKTDDYKFAIDYFKAVYKDLSVFVNK